MGSLFWFINYSNKIDTITYFYLYMFVIFKYILEQINQVSK